MRKNNSILLDGDWSLIYVENKKLRTEKPEVATIEALEKTGYNKIPAKVPGNFERDLFRAGVIEDPYFAGNAIKYQRLENMHMFYYRTFELDREPSGEMKLHFEGIDTAAEIFVNGKLIAETENMLIPHTFDIVDDLVKGTNEIIVHIIPACIASRKYTMDAGTRVHGILTPTVFMRKSPHMFGWDIMVRLVSGGIWRSVWIETLPENRIDDVFAFAPFTDHETKTAEICTYVNTTLSEDDWKEYSLVFRGECGDHVFEDEVVHLSHTSCCRNIPIKDVKLWWPRNYGEQNMYDFTVKLLHLGKVVDEQTVRLGIRTTELERTDTTDEAGSGEFVFRINGKKVFVVGTNWVPADAMHSFDETRTPEILPMLDELGCNMIRIWGGNVYESDYLYNWCDEHGVMIWQDFIMGCALYPQDEEFKSRLFEEASIAVKRLRNHASIVLWAGDNECDEAYFWSTKPHHMSPTKNYLTRRLLPAVLRLHDQSRPFLPSSPYLSEEIVRTNKRYTASELHLWGPRDYFKSEFYKKSICHFVSETVYQGCPTPHSIARWARPELVWPWYDEKEVKPADGVHWDRNTVRPNQDWMAHATCSALDGTSPDEFRIVVTANQVITLFGREPDDLYTFARQSQISQAEAKKYYIERFRVTKWRRTGILWWNLIDGWPQVSDAIVDYYGTKKIAYHYLKRCQERLCLIFDEPENGQLPLYVANDYQEDKTVKYKVTDVESGEVIVESVVTAKADSVTHAWNKDMIEGEKRFYLIEWEMDGKKYKNHYFTNIIDIDYDYYASCMKKVGFWDEFEGFGEEHPKRSAELPYVFDKKF